MVDKPNNRNIEELLSYDLILYDAYCGGVVNNDILEELYKRGAKILTTGNDSTSHIYPITSTEYGSRPELLSIKRVIKNEATFSRATVGGGEDNSYNFITGTVPEAKVLYRHDYYNYPAIIEVENGNGGRWIHSQKILGMNYSENFDDLSMGLLDYITNYISQVHVSDTQYSINDGAWVSYNGGDIPVTQEGYYNIAVRNADNRGVSSDVLIKRIGIDRTSPYFSVSAPSTTQSRTVNVNLSGMGDSLSGIKYAKVSNYSDFRDSTGYTSVTEKTSAAIPITIPFFADINQNYSTRTIYVQLLDSVGNYKTILCTTKYEPKNPQNPVITSPKVNELYSDGEKVNISWNYNDINNDGVKLPQNKAIITLRNTLDSKVYTYVINNAETDFSTGNIDSGIYEVTVQVFNSLGKSAISTPVMFRYNVFNSSGYLLSNSIELSTPIIYINVASIVDLPVNTRVDGYIYYASKITDTFNENKKVKFIISSSITSDNAIRLPEKSSKIMVRWNLYSQNTNKPITPAIDDIIVYGR